MIYTSKDGGILCFKHAVLRVTQRGEDVDEESSIHYRIGCVDCIADKEALDELAETRARRKLLALHQVSLMEADS